MSDKPKKQRVKTGATIDKELYQKLRLRAVKLEKGVGELLDEAIENLLAGSIWPDDNENEKRE